MNPLAFVVLLPGMLVGAVIVWLLNKIDVHMSLRFYFLCAVTMSLGLPVLLADTFGRAFHTPPAFSVLLWLAVSLLFWSQLYRLFRVIRLAQELKDV